ncbi:MAG: hypothetical protein IH631_08070, partial [Candidatus Thorarchaeota archaeon]|nr:hypothetical protein [Candidatus Thorarchaeota archaeon]
MGTTPIWPDGQTPATLLVLLELQAAGDSSDEDEPADLEDLGAAHPDDESVVIVGDKLSAYLKTEVKNVHEMRTFSPSDQCPLCPWRRFPHAWSGTSATRLRSHVARYHVPKTQYCCSGTKQLKVVMSLYDNDVLLQQAPCNLLQRSATILRKTVVPGLDHSQNHIDRHIRCILDGKGVKFVNSDILTTSMLVRRVGSTMYARSFGELLFKELLVHHCKVAAVIPRIAMHMHAAGSELGNLLPQHPKTWWPIVEDIFSSPSIQAKRAAMHAELEAHTEYTSISIDGTMRCCMGVMGQSTIRNQVERDADSAFTPDDSLRRVLSVKGRTGAVLGLLPVSSEKSEVVRQAIDECFGSVAKNQVLYVFCDNASPKLLNDLTAVLPNLKAMALDPVHLPIVYE